jgi:hypothetical protein
MKKLLLTLLLLTTLIYAQENYSEMSTQELIAIMGYVKDENKKEFEDELKSRVKSMTEAEQKQYLDNVKRLDDKR